MSGSSYVERLTERIQRARKRGAQAMTLVGLITVVFTVFLIYVLLTAVRLGNAEAIRAAWIGLAIIVVANALSILLYRSQGKVLDRAVAELTRLTEDSVGDGEGPDADDAEPERLEA